MRVEVDGDVFYRLGLVKSREHLCRHVVQNELVAAELERPPATLACIALLRHQSAQLSDV